MLEQVRGRCEHVCRQEEWSRLCRANPCTRHARRTLNQACRGPEPSEETETAKPPTSASNRESFICAHLLAQPSHALPFSQQTGKASYPVTLSLIHAAPLLVHRSSRARTSCVFHSPSPQTVPCRPTLINNRIFLADAHDLSEVSNLFQR
jgi:hypothetical protein